MEFPNCLPYYISDHFLSFENATASKDGCDIIYHALMQYQKMSKVSNYKRTLFHNKQEVIGHEEYSMQISIGGINKNDFVFWGN